ncbi:MAG TPA: ABC transporter permease subunit, partial [Candidatus Aminicenantes bacterium]|nr:ABC transporter permease subunit [Candidatus Aminicenantes bacterium]
MKNIWAIAKKELRTYFTSPIAYAVITVFLVLTGFFFYSLVWWFNSQSMQMAQNPYYYQQININQMVFSPLYHNMSIILLLMLPLLTMRLFSEEKKAGTEELLYTSPIGVNQIILGKYLAS